MKKIKRISFIVWGVFLLSLFACGKEKSCYDEELYQKHKDDVCTMDCPGMVGCDGKNYCNECIARTQGIKPQ